MKEKGLMLSDFTPETQGFLRQFGISENLDIAEDFNNFMKETYGSDVNIKDEIERRVQEFNNFVRHTKELLSETELRRDNNGESVD